MELGRSEVVTAPRGARAGGPLGWSSESSGTGSASRRLPNPGRSREGPAGDSWKSQETVRQRPLPVDSGGTRTGAGSSVKMGVGSSPCLGHSTFPIATPRLPGGPAGEPALGTRGPWGRLASLCLMANRSPHTTPESVSRGCEGSWTKTSTSMVVCVCVFFF